MPLRRGFVLESIVLPCAALVVLCCLYSRRSSADHKVGDDSCSLDVINMSLNHVPRECSPCFLRRSFELPPTASRLPSLCWSWRASVQGTWRCTTVCRSRLRLHPFIPCGRRPSIKCAANAHGGSSVQNIRITPGQGFSHGLACTPPP